MGERYKVVFDKVAGYFLTVILSAYVLGCVMAVIDLLFFKDSWGFVPISFLVALYSFPIFVVVALPFSLWLEHSKRTKMLSNNKKLIFYSAAGTVAGLLYGFVALPFYIEFLPGLYGFIGGVVYFLILRLLSKRKWRIG